MSRPGFVLEVDSKTPALLTASGNKFSLGRLAVGTNVVYPADAAVSTDPVPLIDAALSAPRDVEPLAASLTPSTKLTIVVIDGERPRPRMSFDVRRSILERVLELAARADVEDVAIVSAGGLNKRWAPIDMTRVLGDRVASSFLPDDRLTAHDVTADDLVAVGDVDGHEVRINARVAQSDVVVAIGAQFGPQCACPLTSSIVDIETLRRLGAATRDDSFHEAVAKAVSDGRHIFAVQAVLGQPRFGGLLAFLSKREWEWKIREQLAFATTRQAASLPGPGAQALHASPNADYAVLDVVAGSAAHVAAEAGDVWRAANIVAVDAQADVVATGVWAGAFDDGDAVGSPINAAHNALVTRFGSHTGTPLARQGGVFIGFHPLVARFSNRRQSAASDFFAKVLPETIDPSAMADAETRACADPWYIDLYRKQFADHPLRTFQTWYRVAEATKHYGDVIWVGGNRRTADLFGHRAATTVADALEIASNTVGRTPSITFLHGPGLPLGDVK